MIADRNNDTPDWAQLLDAARGGDSEALGEICERLGRYLRKTARQELGDDLRHKTSASDVVQQAFLKAHRGIGRFTGDTEEEIRAWLMQLVRHTLIDEVRKFRDTEMRDASREVSLESTGRPLQLDSRDKTPSSEIGRRETDEEMLRAVAELPPRRRRVIEMRFRENRSYAEIGAEFGISEDAARKVGCRAVEQLRTILASDHDHRLEQPG